MQTKGEHKKAITGQMAAILAWLAIFLYTMGLGSHAGLFAQKNLSQPQHFNSRVDSLSQLQINYINNIIRRYSKPADWLKGPESMAENQPSAFKFRLMDSGILKLPSGEKILLIPHSSHVQDSIGDLTVALCQDGKAFLHFGHICGGIINFIGPKEVHIFSARDFFLKTIDDVDDKHWVPLLKD